MITLDDFIMQNYCGEPLKIENIDLRFCCACHIYDQESTLALSLNQKNKVRNYRFTADDVSLMV